MKNSLLGGALLAAFLLAAAPIARAQIEAPNALARQTTNRQEAPPQMASGYELLLQASALIKPGPNGEPSAAEALLPVENLRRQRLAVERNAPALARLREALGRGIALPLADPMANLDTSAKARELARQLSQEAAVRAADGDARGAAQSSLDSLRLGAQIERGSMIQWLVGSAVNSIARSNLTRYAPLLNGAQSRDVAAQWERISASQPSFERILRDEETANLIFLRQNLAQFDDEVTRAKVEAKPNAGELNEAEAKVTREALVLAPAQYHQMFEMAIEQTALPYQLAVVAPPIQANDDPLATSLEMLLDNPGARFGYERNLTLDRLLVATLRLHAIKLESGAYPTTFDAGTTPFRPRFRRSFTGAMATNICFTASGRTAPTTTAPRRSTKRPTIRAWPTAWVTNRAATSSRRCFERAFDWRVVSPKLWLGLL